MINFKELSSKVDEIRNDYNQRISRMEAEIEDLREQMNNEISSIIKKYEEQIDLDEKSKEKYYSDDIANALGLKPDTIRKRFRKGFYKSDGREGNRPYLNKANYNKIIRFHYLQKVLKSS